MSEYTGIGDTVCLNGTPVDLPRTNRLFAL